MTSVFPVGNEWMKWILGFIVGGGAAVTIQSGSAITRLFSTKFTAGTGNSIVSTGEGVAATGFSILSLIIPIFISIVLIIFISSILRLVYKKLHKRNVL